nr:retrovirus-related Pol polyprotein from transposon TNT 1-94 [Tanacetum cinerariifolium]
MLAEAQKARQILDDEQLAFLADPGIPAGQAQIIIPHNVAFQTEDLDTYDYDCDDLSNAQAVLMANISNYGSDVISEVPNSETYLNDMDNQNDMIKEKLALKEKVDSLKQNLSKQIKEKEYLLETFNVFQNKSKEKENKYMEIEINLEKKIKELSNIVFKVGQSAQTVHMLTKLQSFYDNVHKQSLETLILEEESRSKMSKKAKDPEVIAKKNSHKPIDYEKLNRLTDNFRKRFTPQQELSAEQAFWLRISNPTIESSLPPVNLEVPSELPKGSESCEKCLNLDAEFSKSKQEYTDLLKKYSQLKKHCISLEVSMQLKQEVFQNDESCVYQNALEMPECFEKNDLKAQLKDKDTTICKLKDTIKSLRRNNKEEIVDHDRCDLATINEELENSVTKLLSKNERVKCSTSASGSKPSGNTKNNRISQPSSRNKINKVEDQPRSVKTRKNNKNRNYVNDVKSNCWCAIYGKCMITATHHACVHMVVTKMNESKKSKSAKKHKKQNVWKPTGHVFNEVGLKWKPTCRTFTIVGNSCHLTRFTSTNVVPHKQTTSHLVEIQKPKIKVYRRKPKNVKNISSSKIAKIVESKNVNHSKPNHTWGSIATDIPSFSSLVMTCCPDCTLIARIMGYGDYQLGKVIISRVYYVEGLGHNLFFVGQFCDADLEVAFRKNTCFIRNLEGVDLLSGSRDTNLYTISLDDMLKSSPICLFSKVSKSKSWLWHRRLSHLNFGTLNKQAKDRLAQGIPRLKFQKDHLCSACVVSV